MPRLLQLETIKCCSPLGPQDHLDALAENQGDNHHAAFEDVVEDTASGKMPLSAERAG